MGNRTGASFGGKPEASPRKKGRSPGENELKRRLELTDSKSGGLLGMLVHIHYGETCPLQQTWLNGKTQFSPLAEEVISEIGMVSSSVRM